MAGAIDSLVCTLDDTPVLGVSLGNVSLLRLDRIGGPAPGNKAFKLARYFDEARRLGLSRLVSFGGAWSNHLHALAAAGQQHGFETVGVVRGEHGGEDTPTLSDARRCGMQLLRVSREEYRRRHDTAYQKQLSARLGLCLLVPEGGASPIGAGGCAEIAALIRQCAPLARRIVLAVGTGATLAGLAASVDERCELIGISALKGAVDTDARVRALIRALAPACAARWRILHEFHCGGFARASAPLREFMLAFETVHGVPLEPVYTGKALFAIHQLRGRGEWTVDAPVMAIHTGGLQGRRGYPWLTGQNAAGCTTAPARVI